MVQAATDHLSLGQEIVGRIGALGAISETPENLTRIFLSPQHRVAADLLLSWMRDAGMRADLDAMGNVCGRYEGDRPGLPCLMLGSHYDTVRDAGKWDGPLGIVTAISCVAELNKRGRRMPFAIEVVGFADEEGVRFASTLLGSRAVAGTFVESVLGGKDSAGISMREAMIEFGLDPDHIGRGGEGSERTSRLCRTPYRAGAGAGITAIAGRRRHRDLRRDPAGGEPGRHGRPCRNGADGAASRCAHRRRRVHRRDRRNCAAPIRMAWSALSDISMRCRVPPTSSRGKFRSPWISAPRRISTAGVRSPISCVGSRRSPGAAHWAFRST